MSNRRKLRRNRRLRIQAVREALARENPVPVDIQEALDALTPPPFEKEVIKVVPAMANEVHVGDAYLYNDGAVEVTYFKDADPKALAEIKAWKLR